MMIWITYQRLLPGSPGTKRRNIGNSLMEQICADIDIKEWVFIANK